MATTLVNWNVSVILLAAVNAFHLYFLFAGWQFLTAGTWMHQLFLLCRVPVSKDRVSIRHLLFKREQTFSWKSLFSLKLHRGFCPDWVTGLCFLFPGCFVVKLTLWRNLHRNQRMMWAPLDQLKCISLSSGMWCSCSVYRWNEEYLWMTCRHLYTAGFPPVFHIHVQNSIVSRLPDQPSDIKYKTVY